MNTDEQRSNEETKQMMQGRPGKEFSQKHTKEAKRQREKELDASMDSFASGLSPI
jgi:hypothetical protein